MVKPRSVPAAAVVLVLVAGFAANPSRADMASGAVLTNICFSCHGTDGKSAGEMPTIAGKSEKFIAEKMLAFKAGKLKSLESTVMDRIAKGFSDQEIKAIAEFLSRLE